MTGWIAQLTEALGSEDRVVLVTVAHARGSTPREAGTVMVVATSTFVGTIGGGHLEFEALRIARDALARERASAPDEAPLPAWIVRFPLAARLGQCCGGVATLAFAMVDRESRGWVDAAVECERTTTPFALVTPLWDGAPAGNSANARLLVTAGDVRGSLGSAALDSIAIVSARKSLASSHFGATLIAVPNPARVTLLVHVTYPNPFTVLVFGNGHVGHALVQVLRALPLQVRWIDSREHDFPAQVPANVEVMATDTPETELAHAPRGAFIVILTHSHALDLALIETALTRDDWRYLGLIGSKSKRAQFEKRLSARGVEQKRLARIVCPIGAQIGIRSKEPGAIAVAVAAELLAVREAVANQDVLVTAIR
ncbi:MAG: xanthine dehydrogenase accessory protein XdhC [Betaproteobacteria bacterium]|nr:xanthine dehydrogenase accessory protein XdhC [Betaproteobacteria bacterium]MBA3775482.1 xanthine dehydrogenase accessory protein XdhC [Betaproteobacteria bacterium]